MQWSIKHKQIQKTDLATRTLLKTKGELKKVSSSCSNSVAHHFAHDINIMIAPLCEAQDIIF